MTLAAPVRHSRGSFCEPITSEIIAAVTDGVPFTYACQAAGVHYATASRWRQRGERALLLEHETGTMPEGEYLYAKFTLDYQAAQAKSIRSRIKQIDKAGEAGQWQASACLVVLTGMN